MCQDFFSHFFGLPLGRRTYWHYQLFRRCTTYRTQNVTKVISILPVDSDNSISFVDLIVMSARDGTTCQIIALATPRDGLFKRLEAVQQMHIRYSRKRDHMCAVSWNRQCRLIARFIKVTDIARGIIKISNLLMHYFGYFGAVIS